MDNHKYIFPSDSGDLKKNARIIWVIISLKLYKQTVTDSYCLETYTLLFIVDVLLKPAGDAPIMKKKKWAVDRNKRIGWVGEFIKKYLKLTAQDSVVCYITNTI